MGPLLEGGSLELTHGETSSRWGMDLSPWAMQNSVWPALTLHTLREERGYVLGGSPYFPVSSLKRVDSRHYAVVFFREGEGEGDWYSCFQLRTHFPKLVKNIITLFVISF